MKVEKEQQIAIPDWANGLIDEKYKKFHAGLCPGVNNILGIRVPVLRKLAKQIAKEQGKTFLENTKSDYYEEIMLEGLVLGYCKLSFEEFIFYLNKFFPKIDNWAVCDVCTSSFKIIEKNKEQMWTLLGQYLQQKEEFIIRFAIVALLDFYITEEYITKVLQRLDSIQHTEAYYVKMAIAWTISICFIKFPEETMPLLKTNHLDEFTYQKALQKIVESYRIDEETKQQIRKMKKEYRLKEE